MQILQIFKYSNEYPNISNIQIICLFVYLNIYLPNFARKIKVLRKQVLICLFGYLLIKKFIKRFAILTALILLIISPSVIYAINMRSTNYQLQMGDLNMLSGRSTSATKKLTQTGGDLGPGLYSGNNYKVRSGFQYVMSIIPFAFSIDHTTVDFGTLSANTPATVSGTLTISVGGAYGYQVTAFENHQLMVHGTGAKIPDFTGDDGTCTTPTPACTWLANTTYGFGYNMSGTDVPADFVNKTYYKQFADDSAAETVAAIMSGSNVGRNKQATIRYTTNISATQEAGAYENTVTFTATPSF